MAKARAIVKRRKAVRNIRKITKTMQMIATAKFQKSLKRAVGTKPYTLKVRELVTELARSVGGAAGGDAPPSAQRPRKRAVGPRPYARKVRELVAELARSVGGAAGGDVQHPMLRRP